MKCGEGIAGNDDRESNFKWSLEVKDLTLDFQHILKGEIIEGYTRNEHLPDGTIYEIQDIRWVKKSKPLLSEEGIQQFTTMLYSFANRNVFLSNLSERRAMILARDILLTANDKLFLNAEDFKLSPENFELIITELEGQIIPAVLRPLDEGERKFHVKSSGEQTQRILSDRGATGGGVFGTH